MSDNKEQKQDTFVEAIQEGTAPDSSESSIRYAAYASRIRTILAATHRYVAYTSDIGESFRPVAHPRLVSAAYSVSWAYLVGDVAYEGWKARLRQQGLFVPGLQPWQKAPDFTPEERLKNAEGAPDWRLVTLKRGIFQSIASMGLPAFTIHSTVRYSGRALKNVKNANIRTYAPIALGLSVVPALPYLFDEPVEHACDYVFDYLEEKYAKKKLA